MIDIYIYMTRKSTCCSISYMSAPCCLFVLFTLLGLVDANANAMAVVPFSYAIKDQQKMFSESMRVFDFSTLNTSVYMQQSYKQGGAGLGLYC